MKITFANMLAELCELIPGGNVDDVSDALGQDSRIGRKYLTGAVGYGGPCFPRDNSALYFIANGLGYQADLPKAIENFNRQLVGKLANRVYEHVSPGARIGILGLAYKPDTPVVEESQGILLANELARQGLKVMGFDPLANDEARKYLESNILLTKDMLTCIHQADTLVITTPDPTFKKLRMDDFPKKAPPIVIFDCWRILLNELSGCPHIEYIPIGIGKSKSVQLLENIWSASTTA
jgi:UDPglucose 6-dehydrogenase